MMTVLVKVKLLKPHWHADELWDTGTVLSVLPEQAEFLYKYNVAEPYVEPVPDPVPDPTPTEPTPSEPTPSEGGLNG